MGVPYPLFIGTELLASRTNSPKGPKTTYAWWNVRPLKSRNVAAGIVQAAVAAPPLSSLPIMLTIGIPPVGFERIDRQVNQRRGLTGFEILGRLTGVGVRAQRFVQWPAMFASTCPVQDVVTEHNESFAGQVLELRILLRRPTLGQSLVLKFLIRVGNRLGLTPLQIANLPLDALGEGVLDLSQYSGQAWRGNSSLPFLEESQRSFWKSK